ncbi:hypothetical protein V1264_007283 [Littorina saxatilis]|uniref:Uncharacterized protein n=1 Tax=Littorina saxatilis TaxID=31220 RepID=A0AAN9G3L9_9CAEN
MISPMEQVSYVLVFITQDYASEESSLQTGRRGDQTSGWASQRHRTEGYGDDKSGSRSGQHCSNQGDAETGLAAVLAEVRRMVEQAQRDIASLKQDNQSLREAAARCPDTVSSAPGPATASTVDYYATSADPAANLARSKTGEKSHFVSL